MTSKSSYNVVFEHNETGTKLYLGNWAATSDATLTTSLGAVVNCTKANHAVLNEQNESLRFLRIDMPRDGLDKFERSLAFIDGSLSDGRNTLVHCAAGACRSAAIVMYFLMKKNNWTVAQAHAALRSARPIVPGLEEESLAKYVTEIEQLIQQQRQEQE